MKFFKLRRGGRRGYLLEEEYNLAVCCKNLYLATCGYANPPHPHLGCIAITPPSQTSNETSASMQLLSYPLKDIHYFLANKSTQVNVRAQSTADFGRLLFVSCSSNRDFGFLNS